MGRDRKDVIQRYESNFERQRKSFAELVRACADKGAPGALCELRADRGARDLYTIVPEGQWWVVAGFQCLLDATIDDECDAEGTAFLVPGDTGFETQARWMRGACSVNTLGGWQMEVVPPRQSLTIRRFDFRPMRTGIYKVVGWIFEDNGRMAEPWAHYRTMRSEA